MKKGLTLIELLIVIALIGILALMISGNFLTSLKRGRDAKRKSDLKAAQSCMEQYFSVNNSQYQIFCGGSPPCTLNVAVNCGSGNSITIQDPINSGTNVYSVTVSSSTNFTFSVPLEAPNGTEPNPFLVLNQQ